MVIELLIAGLVAFAPHGPGEVTLLLIDTSDWDDAYPASPMPRHHASLGLLEVQLEGGSCDDLEDLGARLGPEDASKSRKICWIPLADRQLSLGQAVRKPSAIPSDSLGDLAQIGPTRVASARRDVIEEYGPPKFLASRAHLRFKEWRACTYVSTIETGTVYAHEWEFRHPLTMAGDGHALRILASSQVLEIHHDGYELVVESLKTPSTVIGRVEFSDDLEEPVQLVIKNSTGPGDGPFPTADPHFVAYYELAEGGAGLPVHGRRIPHRVDSKHEVDTCDNPFVGTCSVADREQPLIQSVDDSFESWRSLSDSAALEAEIEAFVKRWSSEYHTQNVPEIRLSPFELLGFGGEAAVALSAARASAASCAYGPPLCPQALFRTDESPAWAAIREPLAAEPAGEAMFQGGE